MADSKISALTALASGHATGDLLPLVDVSDTTQAASGTTKYTTLANLLANLPGATDANSVSVTGASLTGSNASTLLNLATTWNTSGNPSAIKLNVTNTGSGGTAKLLDLQVGGTTLFSVNKAGGVAFKNSLATSGVQLSEAAAAAVNIGASYGVAWGSAANPNSVYDISLFRQAAGVLAVRGDSSTAGGALEFVEQTAPAAPAADGVRLYAVDNGAGKTQLMALFSSGAAQQVAIQP